MSIQSDLKHDFYYHLYECVLSLYETLFKAICNSGYFFIYLLYNAIKGAVNAINDIMCEKCTNLVYDLNRNL